jgi:hypothetical protein
MNSSLYTADRATHLKIVVVGLSAALLVSVVGIAATKINNNSELMTARNAPVMRTGAPMIFTDRAGPVIR